MTVACIVIPHFSLRMSLLDQPELDGLPLVLTSPPNSRTVVNDCTPEATERGVRPGMLLREVTALCPEAMFIEPNPVREAITFDRILQDLETFSPAIEAEMPGRCYVDLRGLGRHDPSLEAATARLLNLVPSVLRPRAGIAPGKFTAWTAARRAKPGNSLLIAPEEVRTFLSDVPISWLPLEPELVRRIERLGLRTLGELAALPASAIQARFSGVGRHAWNLANGFDDATVRPRMRPEAIFEGLTLPAPSTSREMLLIGLKQLVLRAFSRSELRHRHVRQARLQVIIEDNRSWEREISFREPVGCQRVIEILNHRLQSLELPGAAERLVLGLIGLVTEIARQELLPILKPRRTSSIAQATRQLKQRYGASPLYYVVEVEPWSRIPERRHALMTYDP
jgi:nucleotidyltransferase/DNA polymerase involved in DNA repair